ncbi:MAG TPA: hypothetical protein VJN71_00980 [Nitrososphaerales archaeon]|nr:hypothetical protein [Nitrososphaerales archaeon]
MKRKRQRISSLDLLPFLESGVMNISVNSFPLIKVDCASKTAEIEMRGIHESGIQLFHVMKTQNRLTNVVRNVQALAKELSRRDWQLSLYSMGSAILSLGRGAPSLTGHVSASPLKLRRIVKDLLL